MLSILGMFILLFENITVTMLLSYNNSGFTRKVICLAMTLSFHINDTEYDVLVPKWIGHWA